MKQRTKDDYEQKKKVPNEELDNMDVKKRIYMNLALLSYIQLLKVDRIIVGMIRNNNK